MTALQDVASAAQGLAAAVLAATTDPADGIRLLAELGNFTPADPTSAAPAGLAMAAMQGAMGDLCRRSALASLARASALYQPRSYDDAAQLRTQLCALLDAEGLSAADEGDDASYNALRSLRTAVAADLAKRGASLAPIVTVTLRAPLPALALAYRLYQDIGRTDELIGEGNPPHPAFMPTRFRALAR